MKKDMTAIGTKAVWPAHNGLNVFVEITDAKRVFGRLDYQVKPISGSGEAWVNSETLIMESNNVSKTNP